MLRQLAVYAGNSAQETDSEGRKPRGAGQHSAGISQKPGVAGLVARRRAVQAAPTYCGFLDAPSAPDLQDVQTPKLLPLPRMLLQRPVMLASSPALSVEGVNGVSVTA